MKNKLRRILSVILTAVIVLSAAPMAGIDFTLKARALEASGQLNDYISYTFDEATGTLTISGSGYMPLFGETGSPFYNDSSIINVIIEQGIKSVGDYLFNHCENLTYVTIPDGVLYIGDYAFHYCTSLAELTIPDSVTYIYPAAFFYCKSIKSVRIPKNVSYIGTYAFCACYGLKHITVDEENTVFDSRENCNGIIRTSTDSLVCGCMSTKIPYGVKSIGAYAFYWCYSLSEITIPDSVTSIGSRAFYQCMDLTSIVIPEGVTRIGDYAFFECDRLFSITIPKSVTSIGRYAIYAYYLDEIHLNWTENIPEIEFYEYDGDYSSIDVYIPEGTEELYRAAGGWDRYGIFVEYDSEGNIAEGEKVYLTDTVYYFFDDAGRLIVGGTGEIPDYGYSGRDNESPFIALNPCKVIIQDGITKIGKNAFANIYALQDVTISGSVEEIGDEAFSSNRILLNVTMADGVKRIGRDAFSHNEYLSNVVLPDSITTIGANAFYRSGIISIKIPRNTTSIDATAFDECERLISIEVDESNPVYDSRDNCDAIIVTETDTLLQGCDSTVFPDGITSIGENALCTCLNLAGAVIPDSVTYISTGAFKNCTSLKRVTIPDSVTTIGENAFTGCKALADVYYGSTQEQWDSTVIESGNEKLLAAEIHFNNANEILPDDGRIYLSGTVYYIFDEETGTLTIGGTGAVPDYSISKTPFHDGPKIKKAVIEDGVTYIGKNLFRHCDSIESISFSDTVTGIGDYAFYYCTALKNITIPDSVISIGQSAFEFCPFLASLTLGNSVETIGDKAFYCCVRLDDIAIPASVTSIGDRALCICESFTSISVDENNAVYDSRNNCNALIETATDTLVVGCKNTVIPDGIKSIANYAFVNGVGLEHMEIPDSVTSIGGCAFENCDLKDIIIPDSVTSIGLYAFDNCGSLASVKLSDNITSIGEGTFRYCDSLESIMIPDGVTGIGSRAFYDCESLKSITIPDSVTEIAAEAFNLSSGLTDIYYSGTRAQWNDITVGVLNESLLNATVHFPMITVTLNPQGGSVSPSSVQVEAGESAALPEATRTGFTFLGWSADSSARTGKMTYKPAGDITLYAIWKLDSNKLDDSDFYSFANSADSFGCDTYTVSDGDFEKLAGYVMTKYGESSEITSNTISMLRSEKDKPWLGSCYGMAATIMLDKLGRIGFNENFDTDKLSMYDVDSPSDNPEALSAINYYQLAQFLGFIKPSISFSRSRNWTGGLRNLIQLSKQDSGFMFIYNYEKDGSTLAHAIIIKGYAAEDDNFYYLNAYDSRSPVSDITVQVAKDYSDCAVLSENGTEEPVQIELMTDFSGFDAVDIDGPNNDMILKPEVSAIISDSTVLSILAFGDVTITNADGETITVSDGDVSGTMDIISDKIIVNENENGTPSSATLSFEVADSDYFTFESTAEDMSVSILNDSIYASADTNNADSIVISQDEGVSIDGENAEYKVYLTLNDDYCDMIKLESTAFDGVDIIFDSEGVKVSGVQNGNCKLTSYSGLADEEMFEFSSDDDEILITSGKTGIDVLAQDANGAYTVSLINKLKVKVNGLNLMHKEEAKIRTIITNADAKKCSYAYFSSNPGVAEVDDEGNITTKAPGKTTITCIVADENGRTAESTCTVKVKFTFWQWVIWLLLLGFLRL